MSVVTGHLLAKDASLEPRIESSVAFLHDVVVAVASFETGPKPHLQRILRTLHCRRPPVANLICDQVMRRRNEWIDDHYQFISSFRSDGRRL